MIFKENKLNSRRIFDYCIYVYSIFVFKKCVDYQIAVKIITQQMLYDKN